MKQAYLSNSFMVYYIWQIFKAETEIKNNLKLSKAAQNPGLFP